MASFREGDIVFFRHPKECWVLGKVTGGKAGAWSCKSDDGKRSSGDVFDKLKDDEVTTCREDLLDERPDDLLQLTVLHDATLLRCLYKRYMDDVVYTNIGAIVVALNPFNFNIPWYMDDKMPNYLAEGNRIEKNMPHSWAQAHNTYNQMMEDTENQAILISGESGAGKTEATKIVMKYLAQIAAKRGSAEEKEAGMTVGRKLNDCSPFLETFGNARTVRNDNSSRFGKFMQVKFTKVGQLIGAHTIKYLLEKSRIVTCAEGERVYHSFYLSLRGSLSAKFGMQNESNYRSINAGRTPHNSEYDTAEDFKKVTEAMKSVGIKDDEITSVWACVCAIVSLLAVSFVPNGEGSSVDPSTESFLDKAVQLFKVSKETLSTELVQSLTPVGNKGEVTLKMHRPELAIDVRDALAKATYDGMFSYLVSKSNELCDVPDQGGCWIGLLDIFGFENFTKNSFEQLCINLANETLQNHYNNYIFNKDMEECRAEKIDVTEIKCPDNTPCLNLIVAKSGIIPLLDDECFLPGQGSDLGFLENLTKTHGAKAARPNPFFARDTLSRDSFVVHHYAASVTYEVVGWLEKNRDTLKDAMKLLIRSSEDSVIKEFLEEPLPADKQKGRKITVGGFFKTQVQQLLDMIQSTNPHWIRCIKPHPAKQPLMFDGVQTMNQLESSGVLGTVKIRKAGYPVRTKFPKFTVRYKIIVGDKAKQARDQRTLCDLILQAVGMKDKKFAQLGTTVFMKSDAFPLIERKRNEFLLKHAQTVQRFGKGYLNRLKANRDMCAMKQQMFASLLTKEFRDYLKRSAAVREERARLRREAEIKFRGLRNALVAEMESTIRGEFENTWLLDTEILFKELQKDVAEERRKLALMLADRESLLRKATMSMMQLFNDEMAQTENLRLLREQEIALFYERELDFLEEREDARRAKIERLEKDARNERWRAFIKFRTDSQLELFVAHALKSIGNLFDFEDLSRHEFYSRINLIKKESTMRSYFKRQMKHDEKEARYLEKQHRLFDKQRSHELFKLEQLRRDELQRLHAVQAQKNASVFSSDYESAALHAPLLNIGGGGSPKCGIMGDTHKPAFSSPSAMLQHAQSVLSRPHVGMAETASPPPLAPAAQPSTGTNFFSASPIHFPSHATDSTSPAMSRQPADSVVRGRQFSNGCLPPAAAYSAPAQQQFASPLPRLSSADTRALLGPSLSQPNQSSIPAAASVRSSMSLGQNVLASSQPRSSASPRSRKWD